MPRQTPLKAKRLSPAKPRSKAHRVALVLGGGGLKGFAHNGVFKALKELGIEPTVVAGTSIRARIGAPHAPGVDPPPMPERGRGLPRSGLLPPSRKGLVVR